jgi:hypothetical protein
MREKGRFIVQQKMGLNSNTQVLQGQPEGLTLDPETRSPALVLGSGVWGFGAVAFGWLAGARGRVSCIASGGGVNPKARPSTPKPGPQP